MSKKPLGKDKFGVQKVMRLKDYFGDALGQFSLNAISTMVGQLTYFYTDKVGMAAGAIATMLIVFQLSDRPDGTGSRKDRKGLCGCLCFNIKRTFKA